MHVDECRNMKKGAAMLQYIKELDKAVKGWRKKA